MSTAKKLTSAQRKALVWVFEHQPVSMFPASGPSLSFIKKLESMGLIERAGRDPGRLGFARYQITEAARIALGTSK